MLILGYIHNIIYFTTMNFIKKIVFSIYLIYTCYSANSQDLIKEIQKLTLANDSLQKQVINPLRDSVVKLKNTHKEEVLKLQAQINSFSSEVEELNKKIIKIEKEITDFNNNSPLKERDSLLKKVEFLTATVASLNKNIQQKEIELAEEKRIGLQKANTEKENGKKEILDIIISSYKNKLFDDLLMSNTKLSVQRDLSIIGTSTEVQPIINNLESYFSGEELLAQKFDSIQIKNVLTQLNRINQQSQLLDKLKEQLKFYQEHKIELKRTIEKLIDLDKRRNAKNIQKIQELKFNEILNEFYNSMHSYIHNYYNYRTYAYLSDIVLQLIKRKKINVDADITDLLKKLE